MTFVLLFGPTERVGLFGLYGLDPFHFCSEFTQKLFHSLGHLLGVDFANIIRVFDSVLAESHSRMKAIFTEKPRSISRLQV
jgi:hypothetical protein